MSDVLRQLLVRLSTRRCRGCADPSVHNAHLTAFGRWRYCGVRAREEASRRG